MDPSVVLTEQEQSIYRFLDIVARRYEEAIHEVCPCVITKNTSYEEGLVVLTLRTRLTTAEIIPIVSFQQLLANILNSAISRFGREARIPDGTDWSIGSEVKFTEQELTVRLSAAVL